MGIQRKNIFLAATIIMIAVLIGTVLVYNKLDSSHHWFGIPIWIISLLTFLATLIVGFQFKWVGRPYSETSYKFLVVVVIGCLLCIGLGTYLTEPREYGGTSRLDRAGQAGSYDYANSRMGGWLILNLGEDLFSGTSSGSDAFDLDLDEDAAILILLIILVVILVLAAAFIPHAWVLGGTILCAIAILLSRRASKRKIERLYW